METDTAIISHAPVINVKTNHDHCQNCDDTKRDRVQFGFRYALFFFEVGHDQKYAGQSDSDGAFSCEPFE
jgi:hypothetical protein